LTAVTVHTRRRTPLPALAFGVHCSVFKKRAPDERARTVRPCRSDTHPGNLGSVPDRTGTDGLGDVGVKRLASAAHKRSPCARRRVRLVMAGLTVNSASPWQVRPAGLVEPRYNRVLPQRIPRTGAHDAASP
jgi:hypothetical protein